MYVGILGAHDVLAVDARYRGYYRSCTESGDDGVRADRLRVLRSDRHVLADIDSCTVQEELLTVHIGRETLFERYLVLAAEDAAQLGLLLTEDDLVPALCAGESSLHAAHAAADDEDSAFSLRGSVVLEIELEAELRVYRAGSLPVNEPVAVAVVAAQAEVYLVFLAETRFQRHVRVGEGLVADLDDVRFAGGDDLLQHLGLAETADSGDRSIDVLLDLSGKVDVHAVRHEHCREGAARGFPALMVAAGDVYEVDLSVQHLCYLDSCGDVIAFRRHVFVGAHTDLDNELFSAASAYILDDGEEQPHTVLKTAAPAVRAFVKAGRQELGNAPAVSRMDHDGTAAAALSKGCSLAELVYHSVDVIFGHLIYVAQAVLRMEDFVSVAVDAVLVGDEELRRTVELSAVLIDIVGENAAVLELHRRYGSVALYRAGIRAETGVGEGIVQLELVRMSKPALGIHTALAYSDLGETAYGFPLEESDFLRGGGAVAGQMMKTVGRCE